MNENEILDADISNSNQIRRRKLLPIWIKFFIWIFFLFGAAVPVGLIFGSLGKNFNISLYGLETYQVFSYIGILLITVFALKASVSFGLWFEKDWAINLATFDAILGIIICTVVIFMPLLQSNGDFNFSFRLELFVLIPYLIKLRKIKSAWSISKTGN